MVPVNDPGIRRRRSHHGRRAGLLTPATLPGSRRCHHPSYEKLSSQGWRAIEAEGTICAREGLPGMGRPSEAQVAPTPAV